MILSARGRYAVMAMVELALKCPSKPVTLADLAKCQEIPLPYLEQIFCKLRKSGVVKSVRGPGGGYHLNRAAAEICIADIILAVEEPIKMTRCETGTSGCMTPKTRCVTHDLWEGLGNHIYEYLSSVSLADVCERKLANKSGPFNLVPEELNLSNLN